MAMHHDQVYRPDQVALISSPPPHATAQDVLDAAKPPHSGSVSSKASRVCVVFRCVRVEMCFCPIHVPVSLKNPM